MDAWTDFVSDEVHCSAIIRILNGKYPVVTAQSTVRYTPTSDVVALIVRMGACVKVVSESLSK